MNMKDPERIEIGKTYLITSGTYENFPAIVKSIDSDSRTATVILVVFVGPSPFDVDWDLLKTPPPESGY